MPSEPQNLSREMILPAYKAAISPGSPLSHTTPANSANRLNPQESDCPESENVRRITYEFISKLCKTNPILSASGGFKTLYFTTGYDNIPSFALPKTNPNEPKRTQSKPNFSLVRAPQSQNEPKRTQSKPNFPKNRKSTQPQFSQKVMSMKSLSPKTRTNPNKPKAKPTCPGVAPLPQRRRVGPKVQAWDAASAHTIQLKSTRLVFEREKIPADLVTVMGESKAFRHRDRDYKSLTLHALSLSIAA